MSRSYRRPYSSVCGVVSAHYDKQQAARGVRRQINQWINRELKKEEGFNLVPHRLECTHNEVYDWSRDGRNRYSVPTARNWSEHRRYQQGLFNYRWEYSPRYLRHYLEWPPRWAVEITRK